VVQRFAFASRRIEPYSKRLFPDKLTVRQGFVLRSISRPTHGGPDVDRRDPTCKMNVFVKDSSRGLRTRQRYFEFD
jgi:hypothetical protein